LKQIAESVRKIGSTSRGGLSSVGAGELEGNGTVKMTSRTSYRRCDPDLWLPKKEGKSFLALSVAKALTHQVKPLFGKPGLKFQKDRSGVYLAAEERATVH